MLDLYLFSIPWPLIWFALGFAAVWWLLVSVKLPEREARTPRVENPGDWLKRNYWKALIGVGVVLGTGAVWLYLWEVGLSVRSLVDRLEAMSQDRWASAEDIRNVGTAVALLLGALAAAATLIFQLVKVWTVERATTAQEEGLTTDRINKAVEGLGAEKTHTYRARNVQWTRIVDGRQMREGFTQKWGEGPDIKHRLPREFDGMTEAQIDRFVRFGDWVDIEDTLPNLEVRIGAIFALERIGKDSPRDHVQIMEILCAYIRENAKAEDAEDFPEPEWEPLPDDADAETRKERKAQRKERFGQVPWEAKARTWAQELKPRTDIQTAARVIGRRAADLVERESRDRRHGQMGYVLDLRDADLQGCDLSALDLRKALLQGARLEGADLGEARLEGADLGEARLEGADLGEARLEGADLGGARLEGAYLGGARLEGADLGGARLEGADLGGARLEGADLGRARLEGADLGGARLEGADLGGARLEGADLGRARLEGADLGGARLEGADLGGARLEGADLGEITVSGDSNFNAARIHSAAVKSCDLSKSNLNQDQVNGMFGDGSVPLPEGVELPEHWPDEDLDWDEFFERWEAWKAERGDAGA